MYNIVVPSILHFDCQLRERLAGEPVTVLWGMEGLMEIASMKEVDMVVTSVVGNVGIAPTFEAIRHGKDIALANKETLVSAGQLVMDEIKNKNVTLYPVDSEHSAIFQCLQGNKSNSVRRILLTASGGPFRGKTREELKNVTVEDALKHPNWNVGKFSVRKSLKKQEKRKNNKYEAVKGVSFSVEKGKIH